MQLRYNVSGSNIPYMAFNWQFESFYWPRGECVVYNMSPSTCWSIIHSCESVLVRGGERVPVAEWLLLKEMYGILKPCNAHIRAISLMNTDRDSALFMREGLFDTGVRVVFDFDALSRVNIAFDVLDSESAARVSDRLADFCLINHRREMEKINAGSQGGPVSF
jgi:hypothetical protein